MRYAQGDGLTAEGHRRREQFRLDAARRFEQRVPSAVIAAELRVNERSVRRWRQAWRAGGASALASRGQAAQCRLDGGSWRRWMWRWRPGRWPPGGRTSGGRCPGPRNLVAGKFRVQYTIAGIWYLLQRGGWSCQIGAAGLGSTVGVVL